MIRRLFSRLLRRDTKVLTFEDQLTDYWFRNYVCEKTRLCSLCGNWGWIDTCSARSPAGVGAGRYNYCICPNGLQMRNLLVPLPRLPRRRYEND